MAPRDFRFASNDANLNASISVTILSSTEFVIKALSPTRPLTDPPTHQCADSPMRLMSSPTSRIVSVPMTMVRRLWKGLRKRSH